MSEQISLKLNPELLEKLNDLAEKESRSRSNLIKLAIKIYLENENSKK